MPSHSSSPSPERTYSASVLEGYTGPLPVEGGHKNFRLVATNDEEERAYEFERFAEREKPYGKFACFVHLVKGALAVGVLSSHTSLKYSGVVVSSFIILLGGFYYGYCMNILVTSAQTMCRRMRLRKLSYSDLGEATFAVHESATLRRLSLCFRYSIDICICLDMYGACACYQIIMARALKQLIENTHTTSYEPTAPFTWNVRHYLTALMIPLIMICLIRHLKYLAPLTFVGNTIIGVVMCFTLYYSFKNNPRFEGLKKAGNGIEFCITTGIIMFGLNFAGVLIPVVNNMKDPSKFKPSLNTALTIIVGTIYFQALFGYNGYIEKSQSPITNNFPMTGPPLILKYLILVMVFVTFALTFWAPFDLCFFYVKRCLKTSQANIIKCEYIFRAIGVVGVSLIAISFPDVDILMSFIGCFIDSNMALIWPNFIYLLVVAKRPGFGRYRWKLWRGVICIVLGIFIMGCGIFVTMLG